MRIVTFAVTDVVHLHSLSGSNIAMPVSQQDDSYETITVKALHPTFAAEVQGVDFSQLSNKQLDEVVAALAKVRTSVSRLNTSQLTDGVWRLCLSKYRHG